MEMASPDQENLGLGLKPGDPQYRAYVGPPEDYDLIAAMTFNLLTTLGLRQHHSLLDIGCGSLRIGRLLIPYLNRGKYFGVEPVSKMDKMIYVFDELSGFVHASALIRPTGYEGMDVKSILKKLKTVSFAAQVNREDITDAISRIDQSLEEIIQFIIDHQKHVQ